MRTRGRFPFYRQLDQMDCGPACLRMVAEHYGRSYSLQYLREKSYITREGVSLLGISEAAEAIGMRSLGVRLPFEKIDDIPLPCIVHWRQNHFIVIYEIKGDTIYVADPATGLLRYRRDEFSRGWAQFAQDGQAEGVILALEPSPDFRRLEGEKKRDKTSWGFLFAYLFRYKGFLAQLMLGLFLGTLLSLVFPFLTQAVVDFGINNQDLGFVMSILVAQVMLFVGKTAVEFIRSWILLHLSIRINISIISDFLIKLMKLPLSFFDSKTIGDVLQRIGDHSRIENFLSSTTLNVLFSMVNLVVYGGVLLIYSRAIFSVFVVGSTASFLWIAIFMKKRRELDYKRFGELSNERSNLIELVRGMPEIKLNNAERQKRWEWEHIQARLFKTRTKSLALAQYQDGGANTLKEFSNILITFLAAKAVIDGQMTLGMMMAVTYIVGQLNAPISEFIGFARAYQDAKISLGRLGEIHGTDDEEAANEIKITTFPEERSLHTKKLSFQYEGPQSPFVLEDLTLDIPQGKVTAVVGASGSGKTTLLKLLLKFYAPTKGDIKLGATDLADFSSKRWRARCGVVMQDGYIFNDTIARNIALDIEQMDRDLLVRAVQMANVQAFIESLPLGYNTKIGMDGHGISTGQKQRILIARAAYKNPEYLFFDEATSSLDANNERIIMDNMKAFFEGKTVTVIAHRLSTVKNADQIVVLDKGRIIERGTHLELTERRGAYFHLVKNQLELGT